MVNFAKYLKKTFILLRLFELESTSLFRITFQTTSARSKEFFVQ